MKILWMTTDYHHHAPGGPMRHYYYTLEDEITKITKVTLVGRTESSRDLKHLAEIHDADVVMIYDDMWRLENVDKVSVPVALWCSDPWRRILDHVEYINKNRISLVCLLHGAAAPEYRKRVSAKCVETFQSLSDKIFQPIGTKGVYDVFQTGDVDPTAYPLRNAIYHTYRNNPRCWVRSGFKSIPRLDDYVKRVAHSKIIATGNCHLPVLDNNKLSFFQVKPLEAMATKTLAMMDRPTCADLLHFEDGVNYVEIGLTDFRKKIRYYLEHDEERRKIAEQGYETYLKYHTSAARAKQVYEELKNLC